MAEDTRVEGKGEGTKLKQQEAAKKAELKRKLKAEADAKAWQESASTRNAFYVAACTVRSKRAGKGGVHRCVFSGKTTGSLERGERGVRCLRRFLTRAALNVSISLAKPHPRRRWTFN